MSALYFLIPAALLIVSAVVWLFCWAVSSGQYDDLDTPARRLLMDEDLPPPPEPPSHDR
ncbi:MULTISPECIES: cbb3-type cytochrome oxidase assembly protein CcoS [Pseudomonas]|uniref:Cbb3-type cytochrome oxidase assembly protein CcoS n=1 Tax=Pseudomonas quercus TaxID=2722792 RepID=A0ABX0Y9E3_9PSED|nr:MULTISPECIES: cbb3-type cytochrome oxidase assembly protein CcoS [Pseudomonas]MBF7141416.1 cbb3-type cytochrome oxidase assembly protein CcoS [Pseudomonas sp. LY10J]NJO99954.1 cbb3-type cytochrome oxidase assembly protein CcoS [Pseudomonas quercus]